MRNAIKHDFFDYFKNMEDIDKVEFALNIEDDSDEDNVKFSVVPYTIFDYIFSEVKCGIIYNAYEFYLAFLKFSKNVGAIPSRADIFFYDLEEYLRTKRVEVIQGATHIEVLRKIKQTGFHNNKLVKVKRAYKYKKQMPGLYFYLFDTSLKNISWNYN